MYVCFDYNYLHQECDQSDKTLFYMGIMLCDVRLYYKEYFENSDDFLLTNPLGQLTQRLKILVSSITTKNIT